MLKTQYTDDLFKTIKTLKNHATESNILRKLYNSYNKKIDIVTYHPEVFKNNIYVVADVKNKERLKEIFHQFKPEIVFANSIVDRHPLRCPKARKMPLST